MSSVSSVVKRAVAVPSLEVHCVTLNRANRAASTVVGRSRVAPAVWTSNTWLYASARVGVEEVIEIDPDVGSGASRTSGSSPGASRVR